MTPQKTHYEPAYTTPQLTLNRIDTAYQLAGIAPPRRVAQIEDHLTKLPTLADVATRLAHEAIEATDAEAFIDKAATELARAHAIDELRRAIAYQVPALAASNVDRIVTEAVADLAPAFAKTAKRLSTAAKKLTNRRQPFDLATIVADDTTAEMKTATAALRDLAIYAAVHSPQSRSNVPPSLSRLLPVVHIPDCTSEQIDRYGIPIPNQRDEGRAAIRRLRRAADTDGPDTALVNTARGDYAPIHLSLAASPADLTERYERANRALTRVRAPEPARGKAHVA